MSGVSLSGNPAPTTGQPTTPTTQPTTPTTQLVATPPGSTGSPPATTTTPPTTSTTPTSWYSSLQDADLRGYAEKKGWQNADAAIKSYRELETQFSSRPQPPANADAYKLDAPSDLPAGMTYDKEFSKAFRNMAHKAGLSQEQATALHGAYVEFAKGSFTSQSTASAAAIGERVTKAQSELEAALQAKVGTPAMARHVELAKRAIRMADPGLMDALKEAGVIVNVNGQDMVGNAKIFAALAKMGGAMYAEDGLYGVPSPDINPFDAKTENMQSQAHFIKNDPEKARMLLMASGNQKLINAYKDAAFMTSRK